MLKPPGACSLVSQRTGQASLLRNLSLEKHLRLLKMKQEEQDKWNEYVGGLLAHHKNEEHVEHMKKVIIKILETRIPAKDNWCEGFNTGLEWSVRIYLKDKSAS